MSGFRVLEPGVLSLFQDAGRLGHHALGLTTGGSDGWRGVLLGQPIGRKC